MSVHSRIRQLAQAPLGREQLRRWSGCPVDSWQMAFELAGNYANDRLHALFMAHERVPEHIVFGSVDYHAWHRTAHEQREAVVLAELEAS